MISEPYLDCFGNRKRISRRSPASEEGREKLIASDLHKGSMKLVFPKWRFQRILLYLNLLSVPWVSSNQGLKTG